MLRILLTASTCLLLSACEDPPKNQGSDPASANTAQSEATVTPASTSTEPKPAEKTEEQKAREAEQAEVEANPLTDCCRSLGQRGFMERSPSYIAASKECGEAMTAKKSVTEALPAIKKALGKDALPDQCQ